MSAVWACLPFGYAKLILFSKMSVIQPDFRSTFTSLSGKPMIVAKTNRGITFG